MENTLMLLEDRHVNQLAKLLDDAYDFREMKNKLVGAALEAVDGTGAKISLNFGNKRVSQYIPDEYKDEIHLALDDILDGDQDYEIAIENAVIILDDLIGRLDLNPVIMQLIKSLLELIKAALLVLLDKE